MDQPKWRHLDPKIYKAMIDLIQASGMDLDLFTPLTAKDELLILTGLLNAINHFTKLGWQNDSTKEMLLKTELGSKVVIAWWQLVHNNFDEEPTAETINASDSEAYDWNRLSAIIVKYYLNRTVQFVTL